MQEIGTLKPLQINHKFRPKLIVSASLVRICWLSFYVIVNWKLFCLEVLDKTASINTSLWALALHFYYFLTFYRPHDYRVHERTIICCSPRIFNFLTSCLSSREPVDEVLQMPPSLLTCGGCQQSIGDRFFLKAIEQYWHEDCLSCDLCGCRLGEVGRRLYYKLGRKLCRRDYLRLVWWCTPCFN